MELIHLELSNRHGIQTRAPATTGVGEARGLYFWRQRTLFNSPGIFEHWVLNPVWVSGALHFILWEKKDQLHKTQSSCESCQMSSVVHVCTY